MDRWLGLGFGTSGVELRKEYEIKLVGPESVGSTPATRLQLTPRSEEMQKLLTTVDLWIEKGESYPIQEKALQPSKNYFLLMYSGVMINPPLSNSDFELKVPADVRKIHPSK
jgi:outer membrane lipoprotein-sorting protein